MTTTSSPPQILNVDDSDLARGMRSRILEDAGFAVMEAFNGHQALELVRTRHPLLVVLDVHMPGLDGFEVCQIIKSHARTRHIQVLHVTAAFTQPADWTHGLDAGADSYLIEPINASVLVGVVRALLKRQAAEERARLAEAAAQQALLDSEMRYRELFENAIDILFTFDTTGRITAANRAGEEITGFRRSEVVGQHYAGIVAPEYADMVSQRFQRSLAGELSGVCELEIVGKDGQRIPVEVSTRPIFRNGAVCEIQGVARDVRARKTLEAQLRQSQRIEALGRLAGGIAHDFNNLLTVIHGCACFAIDEVPRDGSVADDLNDIKVAAERAANLTRQLLAFSRKQVLRPETVDLNALVDETVQLLHRLIGDRIQIRTVLAPGGAFVSADQTQLEQVLINLAVNARDAMPDGGQLTITTETTDTPPGLPSAAGPQPYVRLTVADSGKGMDAETQAHIFEPFFTTKGPERGTGLGLATVYGIVTQSGGSISVSSAPAHGTRFVIYWPAAPAPAEHTPTPGGGPDGSAFLRNTTVLIVEDDASVRRLAQLFLESSGCSVLVASNGAEAIQISNSHAGRIDALLIDVGLPGSAGPSVSATVRTARLDIKVLFISGSHDASVGGPLLLKPFTKAGLTGRLRDLLGLVSTT